MSNPELSAVQKVGGSLPPSVVLPGRGPVKPTEKITTQTLVPNTPQGHYASLHRNHKYTQSQLDDVNRRVVSMYETQNTMFAMVRDMQTMLQEVQASIQEVQTVLNEFRKRSRDEVDADLPDIDIKHSCVDVDLEAMVDPPSEPLNTPSNVPISGPPLSQSAIQNSSISMVDFEQFMKFIHKRSNQP